MFKKVNSNSYGCRKQLIKYETTSNNKSEYAYKLKQYKNTQLNITAVL